MIGQRACDGFPFTEKWKTNKTKDELLDVGNYLKEALGRNATLNTDDHDNFFIEREGHWACVYSISPGFFAETTITIYAKTAEDLIFLKMALR